MIGYTLAIQRSNAAADPKLLGVQFGRLCIQHDIPVGEIADLAGVSRTAVYDWFCGKYSPRAGVAAKIRAHIDAVVAAKQ